MDADGSDRRRFMGADEVQGSKIQIRRHQEGTDDREVQALRTERRDSIHNDKSNKVPGQVVRCKPTSSRQRQEAQATGKRCPQED